MSIDDETFLKIAEKLLNKTDSGKIEVLENELSHLADDIRELKTEKKEEPKKEEMKKDKNFQKKFVVVSGTIGILGFIMSVLNFLFNNFLKKP